MRFEKTPLAGCFEIEIEPHSDDRGFFARTWCRDELAEHGLTAELAQCSVSYNKARGTLRGLHLQVAPHSEAKLVRCSSGALWDVVVDLRRGSPTAGRWHATELNARRRNQLFVPEGCAHGFLTLEDDTEVEYLISVPYAPDSQRGFRFDDPTLGITWPEKPRVISDRDRELPLWNGTLLET